MWLCELLTGLQYDYCMMCNAFCSCHGALNVLHVILESEVLDVTLTTKSRETPVILSASHSQEEAGLELLTAIPAYRLVRELWKGEECVMMCSIYRTYVQ